MTLRNLIPPPVFILAAASLAALPQLLAKNAPATEPPTLQASQMQSLSRAQDISQEGALQSDARIIASDDINSLGERPLFAETRRKPVPPAQPEEIEDPLAIAPEPEPSIPQVDNQVLVEAPPPPEFLYLGFVRSGNSLRALIRNANDGEEKWLEVGETMDGWDVVSIDANQVAFEKDGFSYVLEAR